MFATALEHVLFVASRLDSYIQTLTFREANKDSPETNVAT